MTYSTIINRLRNFRIGRGKIVEFKHSVASVVGLVPGVYYRMALEPEFYISDLAEGIFNLLGYQAKELLNKSSISYLRIIHPEYDEIIAQKKKLCLQSREANKLKHHLFTKSGSAKLIEDKFIGEYDRAGRLIAINGYFKEIKKSSVKLQLHNQLNAYRAALDVNIISSITDSNGIIIYVNNNFRNVFQYSDEELLGKSHSIVNSGYHPRSLYENMWNTISSGKMWQGELLNRAKDGSLQWMDTVIIPTLDERNKITSYLSLRMLITERKEAEEQREKYIRVLERIAHVVAHDLRGPVCSILGLANIYEKMDCRDQEERLAVDYLADEASKLDQITRKLSERIHTANLELKRKISAKSKEVDTIETTKSIEVDTKETASG